MGWGSWGAPTADEEAREAMGPPRPWGGGWWLLPRSAPCPSQLLPADCAPLSPSVADIALSGGLPISLPSSYNRLNPKSREHKSQGLLCACRVGALFAALPLVWGCL